MEVVVVGVDGVGFEVDLGLLEDDLVLFDDVVQYIKVYVSGILDEGIGQVYFMESIGFFDNFKLFSLGLYGQCRMVVVDFNVGFFVFVLGECYLGFGVFFSLNKNNMFVQWNEVSFGIVDVLVSQVKFLLFFQGNLVLVQQKFVFGQYLGYSL